MSMPLYLAMTAAEISRKEQLPQHLAYMACHFSPYSTGLSNMPNQLPKNTMVILNDRIPVCGQDPDTVACQLAQLCEETEADSILLDLQRPFDDHTEKIVRAILDTAVCPVGVSEIYAYNLDTPVFISVPPLNQTFTQHAKRWEGREIWLEAALEQATYAITETDCRPVYSTSTAPLSCPSLFCHYGFREEADQVILSLERTREDLLALIDESPVTKTIGLYQQLGNMQKDGTQPSL